MSSFNFIACFISLSGVFCVFFLKTRRVHKPINKSFPPAITAISFRWQIRDVIGKHKRIRQIGNLLESLVGTSYFKSIGVVNYKLLSALNKFRKYPSLLAIPNHPLQRLPIGKQPAIRLHHPCNMTSFTF